MRRLVIILGSLVGLILLLAITVWLVLLQQIKALPVSDLSIRLDSIGLTHVQIARGSLIYHADGSRIPVRAEYIHAQWAWQGWRPELTTVEVANIAVRMESLPQPADDVTAPQWPQSWELPEGLPEHLLINQFSLDLACPSQRCVYTGSLDLSFNAVATVTANIRSAAAPENSVTLQLNYSPAAQDPRLDFALYGPADSLHSHGYLHLTDPHDSPEKQVRFELNSKVEGAVNWLLTEMSRWDLEFPSVMRPWLTIAEQGLTFDLSGYGTVDPHRPWSEWLEYSNGELNAVLFVSDQLTVQMETSLQHTHNNQRLSHGSLQAEIQSQAANWLGEEVAFREILLTHHEPALLNAEWQLAFDPVTVAQQDLDGQIEMSVRSPAPFTVPGVGQIQAQADGQLFISAGTVEHYQLEANGLLRELAIAPDLAELSIELGDIRWQLTASEHARPELHSLPAHFEFETTGPSQLTGAGELSADITSGSVNIPQLSFSFNQSQWQQQELILSNIRASLDLHLNFAPQYFNAESVHPIRLDFGLTSEAIRAQSVELEIGNLHVIGTPESIAESQLSASAMATVTAVEQAMLRQQEWHWQGQFDGTLSELEVTGLLTNQQGLRLPHSGGISDEGVQLDWQLSDIFLLAGNPIASSLADWPEMLLLQRGRLGANGSLWLPFSEESLTVTGSLEAADIVGIYDTAEFSGLNAVITFELNEPELVVQLPELTLQRIRLGFDMGPLLLSGRFRGPLTEPMQGVFTLEQNRLALFNGLVTLDNTDYRLSAEPLLFNLNLYEIDLNRILTEYPAADIQGHGLLSGTIPVLWSSDGVQVDQGRVDAVPPGGRLQLQSQQAQQMAASNQAMQIVVDALADFHYSVLESGVSYDTDGTLLLSLRLEGRNPAWHQGHPVNLNITLEENLPALITSLQLANQLNTVIQERVQQRVLQSRFR